MAHQDQPKDCRMVHIRKKLRRIGRDLTILRYYLKDHVPHDRQKEFKQQLQRAFDAGRTFSEVQDIPQSLPVGEDGLLQIGPELRYHILETRKIYGEVDQLRELVADIFDEKSEEMIRKIFHEQEEKTTGTESVEIEL
jgi:hypothetical protein